MPLVGDVKAAGRTPTELREAIKSQLQNFLKLAAGNEVTVAVRGVEELSVHARRRGVEGRRVHVRPLRHRR